MLEGQGCANSNRQASTHDAIGTDDAQFDIGDVQRAALRTVVAVATREELGIHVLGIAAARQNMAVTTVRTSNIIVRAERGAGTDRDRLLPNVGMEKTGHEARTAKIGCTLLKTANQHHVTI